MTIGQTVKYEGHKLAKVVGIGYGMVQVATETSGYTQTWWAEAEYFQH